MQHLDYMRSEYVPLPAIKGPDGKGYVTSDPDHYNYGRNELLVTTKAKNPAKLLQWFDKFYIDDASIQNFYGSFRNCYRKRWRQI